MTSNGGEIRARELYLNLVRAHERLSSDFAALFRAHGITQAQFNVLRILIGGPAEGAPCQYIRERLLQRVPDVTRLLDRMESAGLVSRTRSTTDRRVVLVRVTDEGRAVCAALEDPVTELHRRHAATVPPAALDALDAGLRALVDAD